MSEAPTLVRAHAVSKTYPDGQVQALRDVSLSVDRGEYLAIMGPSGCGKSTLLNLLGALDRPSAGEIFFEGQRLSALRDLDRFRADKVGFVFQSFLLLPTLTAAENVQVPMFTGPLGPGRRARKALDLLALVGMAHRAGHRATRLSVGERQRVAIARALANDPVLLLADEPTGNLDSTTASGVLDLFDRLHAERGTTLVIVTHGEDVAARARRVLRMRDGRVLSADEASPPKAP
jgi:putative ABC transport system ATP-binding protein